MTLHEAIEKLLEQTGGPMTTSEIASELNKNGWYRKKDKSLIEAFQIHGRTKNYPVIFGRDGSTVYLLSQGAFKAEIRVQKEALANGLIETAASSENVKRSFDPISNPDTRILILGSMPGDKSLELGEYYGHPRNRFWRILATITNSDLPIDYADKKAFLFRSKIGVWDVAYKANRKGSLDSAIKEDEPNKLDEFISAHKNLKTIAFNGKKSQLLFEKHFDRKTGINYITLPSSSPANAGISFDEISNLWRQVMN